MRGLVALMRSPASVAVASSKSRRLTSTAISPSKPAPLSDPFEAAHVDLLLSPKSPFHRRTTILKTCTSTQEILRTQLPPAPAVLATEVQTKGHGRPGKPWLSENPLGLWVSILLEVPSSQLPLLSLLASLAAADAVRALTQLEPALKWPNDLLLKNRKLAGVLVETISRVNQPPLVLLGLGLNLHHQTADFPSELKDSAISLFQASRQRIPRSQMLAAFLGNLTRRLDQPAHEAMEDWRQACFQLGRTLSIRVGTTILTGTAETLDDSGHLHLRLPDGSLQKIASGETDFPA